MQKDYGSRDTEFVNCIEFIRTNLVSFAGLSHDKYTCIPMQGAGTMGVESVIGTTVPRDGKMLICTNGAYGDRIGEIAKALEINAIIHKDIETEATNVKKVEEILINDKSITNVAMVHCETTTGVFNPIEKIGQVIRQHAPNAAFFVDAMSSFAAVPIDFEKCGIDFLVSSANKCTEGVPGFSFILANVDKLLQCEGNARSLSLDALAQYKGFRANGQFRFTPPTHVLMAFRKAIEIQNEEGGVTGRSQRYQENRKILKAGMKEMGFKELLKDSDQGYIITSFYYPDHPNFDFEDFYTRLSEKGQVIYPGKVSQAACFRIGNIGQLYPEDMNVLLKCIKEVCSEMNIPLPLV
ncbi:2-aminoethylphosphonate--pyruvate transaminase [Paramuricea clavata]|uniref:Alanine--glyoxylate aminotransferase n=2 Tax=Paramuricea clavata TaxID=317549 RepID=A0A7D9JPP1_PARCT|nr:2-aminoethylphosphonate--pyruvate transaminase [Paramuricea clavata]